MMQLTIGAYRTWRRRDPWNKDGAMVEENDKVIPGDFLCTGNYSTK